MKLSEEWKQCLIVLGKVIWHTLKAFAAILKDIYIRIAQMIRRFPQTSMIIFVMVLFGTGIYYKAKTRITLDKASYVTYILSKQVDSLKLVNESIRGLQQKTKIVRDTVYIRKITHKTDSI